MRINNIISDYYENHKLIKYSEFEENGITTVNYDDLPNMEIDGVLKASYHVNGKLVQTYTTEGNHVGVIAATRLGKTTSYVIPTVISFARQKEKKSFIISDPKGEIYRMTAKTLEDEGYNIKVINFRDYMNSECWNILTPIYRLYHSIDKISEEVDTTIDEDGVKKYVFRNTVYKSKALLNFDLQNYKEIALEEVSNKIDDLAGIFIVTQKKDDPYWEDSARELLKAFIWAMLEDSVDPDAPNAITEDTFSFSTIIRVIGTFHDDGDRHNYNDNGYFTDRDENSRALLLAKNTLIENAGNTRRCVLSQFMTSISMLRNSAARLITSCNSFEFSELVDKPTAIFLDYKDELKTHYDIISLFVQDAYRYLISVADKKPNSRLDIPFYFILDEFGNFPKMRDFDTTISACAGRNIFFILILQSYAQLYNVYEDKTADIIIDNLNVHIFFGSNNTSTLQKFSEECGNYSRLSPVTAFNGNSAEIQYYNIESVPLVPVSRLRHFAPGECIVTEANCKHVLYSNLERYYLCDEFVNLPKSDIHEYKCPMDLFNSKYVYTYKKEAKDSKKYPWE